MDKIDFLTDWLEDKSFDLSQLAQRFFELDRGLTETDSKEEIDKHIDLAWKFLRRLAQELPKKSKDELKPFLPVIVAVLGTIVAEIGPYRYETYTRDETEADRIWGRCIREEILPAMKELREASVNTLEILFHREEFVKLRKDIEKDIIPLLRDTTGRYLPFRVLQVCKLADKLFDLKLKTEEEDLRELLSEIHALKYPRFGTSGLRGLWGIDFVEEKAKTVTQAICDYIKGIDVPDYMKSENLGDKYVVIGYDSREHADEVASWVAQVCLLNHIKVYVAERDTPTPALIYWAIEHLGEENVAGIINCTASHNPVEWQGIKYSPQSGCPAPTTLTDFIAARSNQIQLLGKNFPAVVLAQAMEQGKVKNFNPIKAYCNWLLSSGQDNSRIKLDIDVIRNYFSDKKTVIDEMHGAGREYLRVLLSTMGVSYEVLHGEKDPKLGELEYADPEPPHLEKLQERIATTGATLGVALDTDADRYGVVDKGGQYFRPNQILPMLALYLGRYKGLKGKIVRTVTTSQSIDAVARSIHKNKKFEPDAKVAPNYVTHPFYEVTVGKKEDMTGIPNYVTMVGIKYVIADGMQSDRFYRVREDPNFRNSILIGGEESAGFTTKGHLPDKDGIWANLLIMDMIASHGKPLNEIWSDFMTEYGAFYGDRVDVDASDEAKERLISYFLTSYKGLTTKGLNERRIAGLRVVYLGGVRHDLVEIHLEDDNDKTRSFLAIRASGTEPLNRIYTESNSEDKRKEIEAAILCKLEDISVELISTAYSDWKLVDILSATEPTTRITNIAIEKIENISSIEGDNTIPSGILDKLKMKKGISESRRRKTIDKWLTILAVRLQS